MVDRFLLELVSAAALQLKQRGSTRVFRLFPSRTLDFNMLAFSKRNCDPAFALGEEDAGRFLDDPLPYLA